MNASREGHRDYKYASSGLRIGLKPSKPCRQCKEGNESGYKVEEVPGFIQAVYLGEEQLFLAQDRREAFPGLKKRILYKIIVIYSITPHPNRVHGT